MRYVILVDCQYDFVYGPLGSEWAKAAMQNIKEHFKTYDRENTTVIFTQDTHYADTYADTIEGQKLPVPHCILGTHGWEIVEDALQGVKGMRIYTINPFAFEGKVYKETFGSLDLVNYLYALDEKNIESTVEEIIVAGVCTDICVISNVLLLKAAFPETPIKVIAKCCAGVTPKKHKEALSIMESCHIEVIYD